MNRMLRPKANILPESAIVPEKNLQPRPLRFTHVVSAEQPFYFVLPAAGDAPAGMFKAGTKLLLADKGNPLCHVVDEQGLSVLTFTAGLSPLTSDATEGRPKGRAT